MTQHRPNTTLCLLTAALIAWSGSALSIDLSGTVFAQAAQRYNLDPVLVYAVALAESGSGRGHGTISPWPWTIRTQAGPFYGHDLAQAQQQLTTLQQQYGDHIDVGLMQINLHWHGDKVASPASLLRLKTNVMVGAQILAEAIQSAPGDLIKGIGRYHTWNDTVRGRNYGQRVMAIMRNLSTR